MRLWEIFQYYFNNPFAIYYDNFYGETTPQILYTFLFEWWLWVPLFLFIFKFVILELWLYTRNEKYGATIPYMLIAIDVPKKNEQSIHAMERVFEQIQGMHGTFNFLEKWIEGMYQLSFSCEIVAIDGYIQLIMRIPVGWRDAVEASIYGQFPDAEITEVEDYVNTVPSTYPNETHDMWGVEWTFDDMKNPYKPIKTFTEFEDSFNQLYVDPLAGLFENMSKLKKGEQLWLQMVAKPLEVPWYVKGEPILDQMLGREKPKKLSFFDRIMQIPVVLVNDITEQIATVRPLPEEGGSGDQQQDLFGKLWRMSPGEQDTVKAMQKKMSKLAYSVKMRYGYFYEKDKGNKIIGVNGTIGSIKQFNSLGRQGFRPMLKQTGTSVAYFRVKERKAYRQTRLTAALKGRSTQHGMKPMIWSVEEFATMFHFPSMELRAPMLKKTELVKANAPVNLPFEDQASIDDIEPKTSDQEGTIILPWEEQLQQAETPGVGTFDYDSDDFENRFAVDKKAFAESREQRAELLEQIQKEEEAKRETSSSMPEENTVEKVTTDELGLPYIPKTTTPPVVDSFDEEPNFSKEDEVTIVKPTIQPVSSSLPKTQYKVDVIDFHKGVQMKKETKEFEESNEEEIPPNLPFV